MPTKHAHDHFDLIIHVDIKTSKNENFTIIRHKTIYFLDQEYMHVFFLSSLGHTKLILCFMDPAGSLFLKIEKKKEKKKQLICSHDPVLITKNGI